MNKRLPLAVCTLSFVVLTSALILPNIGFAQQKPDLAGDYTGVLGPYHVKLHITVGKDGKLTGTADNPDAGLSGMPCTNFSVNGQALSYTVPIVQGTWSGVISGDGASLSGIWSSPGTSPMPLNFTRVTASNAAVTANAAGGAQTGTVSRVSSATYGGMAMTQDDVNYDGSTFKVTSVNGVPRSVVEMRPGGQFITSTIMPNGRIMTYPASSDSSYADRIRAVLKIDAAGPAAASTPEAAAASIPASAPSTSAASGPASASAASGAASDNQQGLQNYEGSLGSLGTAQILMPGDSIKIAAGTLTNGSDSHRVLVYFPRTGEKVSFSSGKSSDHKDDVVVLAGSFGAARMPVYAASTVGSPAQPQYTEYLIHFVGGNSNLKHMFEGGLKADTADRAKPGASRLGTNSQAHTASFTISTVDAEGHVHESLSSRQVDDWMNSTAYGKGLGVDKNTARAAGLAVVADKALEDQGKEDPKLRHAKKDYGLGTAMQADLDYFAFGAGGLDKPGAQEKRDQRIGATAGALGTTSPQ